MSSNTIDLDGDSPDLTGVVGYELAQSYETAKTLLLVGFATCAIGSRVISNFEPVEGLPGFPELIIVSFAVLCFIIGGMMMTLAASIIIAYIRTVGVTHYVKSALPF